MEVAELLSSVNILDYISQYCDLSIGRDGEYWGCSPLKNEKTPSFSVNEDEQIFYDFSSHNGGNVISFIVAHDKCTVKQAIKKLKDFAGIKDDVNYERPSLCRIAKKYTERYSKKKDTSERMPLSKTIMDSYEFRRDKLQIWVDEGISFDTLAKFSVMYDPNSDRIVFPIKDNDGNIVSVCGRTLDPLYKEKHLRKYTYFQPIVSSDFLYGYSDCVNEIKAKKEVILFEGAKSVMKAYEWGFGNCCALLTSHLNRDQMLTLAKLGAKCVFALDEDVDMTKDDNINTLKHFTNVSFIKNRDGILAEKMSPVDAGENAFRILYERRE